ncbi:MAG: hypothetical protein ACK49V_16080 [Actinomycetes bacterium]|jgi:hypothetical protein
MTKKPANPSPTTNPSATKRAARTEAFRQKNARRRAQRADKRSRLTLGQYLEWRRQMRLLPFHSDKVKREILDGNSLNQSSSDRSPIRVPK